MAEISTGTLLMTGIRRCTVGVLLLTLAACGGGSGGDGGTLDPLVEDFGIAYVRLPVPETDTADVREPADFTPGADLIYRDLAAPDANERNVTWRVTGGMGDVKDVEVSYDGSKLLFALRLPEIEGADPEDQPTWNIWEYEIATDTLRRVISSDIRAENGQDVAPHYLPDGRIIFSSDRQRSSKALLLDESKPQFTALDESRRTPAMLLHVMDENGENIRQVSFNQSHDLDPVVLESGEVVFSRWDNVENNNAINLYKMNPDGSNTRLYYGSKSHDTGTNGATVQFTQAREMPDGGLALVLKPFTGNYQGGDIVTIDVDNYVENTQPTAVNRGVLTGPAQASATINDVRTDDQPSPGGRFNAFYPLWDGTNRALVSWSQCRLMENNRIVPCSDERLADPNVVEAPPLYNVYLYDMDKQTQLPVFVPQEGVMYRDVVATQPRQLPAIIFDQSGPASDSFDPALVSQGVGILNIRSVYDFDGTFNNLGAAGINDIDSMANPAITDADSRPARFLRIVKAVSIPDRDVVALNGADFGVGGRFMREIIGYAPIEPDGSVRVKIPANIPFTISILDREGKRISTRHRNWMHLRPGEILNCTGCHDTNSPDSHGRADAFISIHDGADTTGVPFYNNTVLALVDQGDSMAEARTRADASALNLTLDILYQDVWTDDTIPGLSKAAPFEYRYATPDPDPTLPAVLNVPVPPLSSACWQDQANNKYTWNTLCRIIINYETHIHPLWSKPRGAGGVDTCINCHTRDNAGVTVVPAGQLELTDGVANNGQFTAYRELLVSDLELVLDSNGNLVIREEPVFDANGDPVYVLDANGDPVLDINGQPVQQVRRFGVAPSMRAAGARLSNRFFDRFSGASIGTVDHTGMLNPAELKLIAEWLDIGAQYYNNPFDVP